MATPLQKQLDAIGVSITDLLEIGFDDQRANAILKGADPNIDEVRLISKKFKIPARNLIADLMLAGDPNFRLRENFKSLVKNEGSFEALDLATRAEYLSTVMPRINKARTSFDIPIADRDFRSAEELAAICRSNIFGVGPTDIVKDLDYLIYRIPNMYIVPLNLRRVEGAMISYNEIYFAFLAERNDARMRFTLAHELCHYFIDFTENETGGWFDSDILHNYSVEHRISENFANTFASAFLMPAEAVGFVLQSLREKFNITNDDISDLEIALIGQTFGVNFQVAGRRLEDLKLLERGSSASLYSSIRKRFKSPDELLRALGFLTPEKQKWDDAKKIIVRSCRTAVINGEASIGRISEVLDMRLIDVAKELDIQ